MDCHLECSGVAWSDLDVGQRRANRSTYAQLVDWGYLAKWGVAFKNDVHVANNNFIIVIIIHCLYSNLFTV